MPRRKQARHTDVKDIRSILRLTFEQELSIRAVSERLKISKTSVSTYLLRAREKPGLRSGRFHRAWMMTRFWSNDYSAARISIGIGFDHNGNLGPSAGFLAPGGGG
ncbi:sigma-70-like protein [Sinorhizobium medicae]|nr:sigma-70-like protein [Sinorhizobium medicae]TWA33806.1 sigma-70-like protein [Sinorhizobium medicae]TWA38417.1 sigma-70-like protein [Sinorhizobium medicae]